MSVDKHRILNDIADKIGGVDGLVIRALASDDIVQTYIDERTYFSSKCDFVEWVIANSASVSLMLDCEKQQLVSGVCS